MKIITRKKKDKTNHHAKPIADSSLKQYMRCKSKTLKKNTFCTFLRAYDSSRKDDECQEGNSTHTITQIQAHI